jgi:hypothetical protein
MNSAPTRLIITNSNSAAAAVVGNQLVSLGSLTLLPTTPRSFVGESPERSAPYLKKLEPSQHTQGLDLKFDSSRKGELGLTAKNFKTQRALRCYTAPTVFSLCLPAARPKLY